MEEEEFSNEGVLVNELFFENFEEIEDDVIFLSQSCEDEFDDEETCFRLTPRDEAPSLRWLTVPLFCSKLSHFEELVCAKPFRWDDDKLVLASTEKKSLTPHEEDITAPSIKGFFYD